MANQTASTETAVLDEEQAARYIGVSKFTLRRLREAKTGPKILRLSPRRIGYRKATLDAWLAERELAP